MNFCDCPQKDVFLFRQYRQKPTRIRQRTLFVSAKASDFSDSPLQKAFVELVREISFFLRCKLKFCKLE